MSLRNLPPVVAGRARVFHPYWGSSGMLVEAVRLIRARAKCARKGSRALRGSTPDISVYCQELRYITWRLGIDGQIARGDIFHKDRHPDCKADYILANPHFNISAGGGERLRDGKRSQYGAPPVDNADFTWVRHRFAPHEMKLGSLSVW